ncbi:MAG: HDIG domain-containing protein [Desulfosalsimonadaceae bacterium]
MNMKLADIHLQKQKTARGVAIGILLVVTILTTLIFYPNLVITPPAYDVGDIVEENIKAPRDFFVEDDAATAEKRQQARSQVQTVYDYDPDIALQLNRQVQKAFAMSALSPIGAPDETETFSPATESSTENLSSHTRAGDSKAEFESMLGIPVSAGAYSILEKEGFSSEIAALINETLNRILDNGVVSNKEMLLREQDRGITLKTIGSGEEVVVWNLRQFYGLDQAKTMVRVAGDPLLRGKDYNLVNLIVDITQRLIQPNITLNRTLTENRKQAAEKEIKPILYQIKKGEMILREGQRVTETDILKLNALTHNAKDIDLLGKRIGTALIIFWLLVITYFITMTYRFSMQAHQNRNLLFMGSVLVIFFVIAQMSISLAISFSENVALGLTTESMFYGIPLAAAAMTVCQFAGFSAAFPFAIVVALIAGLLFENSYVYCIYFLASGIVGAYWIQNARRRKDFIVIGAKLGALNIVMATSLTIYLAEISAARVSWDAVFAFLGGISAGILTIGVSPLVEMVFKYTTDSTLAERANLDQPLMRRLMLEAPGTYHHSVIVGSLVEAAAAEIGANPLLAKVCGYYHDIGKLKNPQHFIENQKNGKNIHNKLAPSMSCLILISHIKNGVELARENRLEPEIIDAIKQHHGTSTISFFYEKAKQQKKDQPINIDHFRYPGPKPQTKETALVMLADQVEAASRTLENPSHSRLQGLVQFLINKIFSDNQLNECPLTLKDLHIIARTYVKILTGIHHHRVEYPDKPQTGQKKEENGGPDHKRTESAKNTGEPNQENGAGSLKRLGQS